MDLTTDSTQITANESSKVQLDNEARRVADLGIWEASKRDGVCPNFDRLLPLWPSYEELVLITQPYPRLLDNLKSLQKYTPDQYERAFKNPPEVVAEELRQLLLSGKGIVLTSFGIKLVYETVDELASWIRPYLQLMKVRMELPEEFDT